jgi:hypothetical protein
MAINQYFLSWLLSIGREDAIEKANGLVYVAVISIG